MAPKTALWYEQVTLRDSEDFGSSILTNRELAHSCALLYQLLLLAKMKLSVFLFVLPAAVAAYSAEEYKSGGLWTSRMYAGRLRNRLPIC